MPQLGKEPSHRIFLVLQLRQVRPFAFFARERVVRMPLSRGLLVVGILRAGQLALAGGCQST